VGTGKETVADMGVLLVWDALTDAVQAV
jgi:hypothetical protein